MEEEEKKFYELDEDERKEVYRNGWKKAKPIVKRILLILVLVLICFLLAITLIGRNAFDKTSNSEAIRLLLSIN